MLAEHNPIAELIHKIQAKWIKEVSPFPHLQLVRWLYKPEEARLFEGFLQLEATPHGALPEVVVTLLTPFEGEDRHAGALYHDWMKALREDKAAQQLLTPEQLHAIEGVGAPGNGQPDASLRLLSMLRQFQQSLPGGDTPLVVALLPRSIHDLEGYRLWLIHLLKKGIPSQVTFMVFDHIGAYYLDSVVKKDPDHTKSLSVILDLDGAVSKIAKAGNPHSPQAGLNECILEMGKGVQQNSVATVDRWGERALLLTQRSGMKSLFATAHLVYAGMLFNFKQYEKIDALLQKGLQLATQGMAKEAGACKPLLIQAHGYSAASLQLQKKMTAAIAAFQRQGDTALEYQLPGLAINAYRQAYTLSKKQEPEQYPSLLQKAFDTGRQLTVEEQRTSALGMVAADLLEWYDARQRFDDMHQLDRDMKKILGDDWKETAKAGYEAAVRQATREAVT
ncbi:hypothetical protein [Paraflavitalea pollutisoli]|uniref:hypothetical protein n=1 Tax=Paraflavitalea pollutisoli TaxID=3034143 RepID=UPI0023EDBBFA|nr:hypothetical protein [Paraflavitalea sp. H1-2-19X]